VNKKLWERMKRLERQLGQGDHEIVITLAPWLQKIEDDYRLEQEAKAKREAQSKQEAQAQEPGA
jgi:hypothetical protein